MSALGETYAVRQMFFDQEAGYNGRTIRGNFDNGYAEVTLGLAGTQGSQPQFLCDEADVDPDPTGRTLIVEGVVYEVLRGERDGTGVTRLVLRG